MGHISFSEITVISLIAVVRFGIPIAAAIWAIKALINIRSGQDVIQSRLEAIERAIQGNPSR
jgi:hypothetical protein